MTSFMQKLYCSSSKVFTRPLRSGRLRKITFVTITACTGYYLYDYLGSHELETGEKVWREWRLFVYQKLPKNVPSRVWGWLNDLYLPVFARKPLIGLYARAFQCNLDEADDPVIENYENLGQFFRRNLKPGIRPVAPEPLVSPSDGKILDFGEVLDHGILHEIKGIDYTLDSFFGKDLWDQFHQQSSFAKAKGRRTKLYRCVIYLAPGDYHHFHSPVDFEINHRRHITGKLLSVAPVFAKQIPGLFSMNERVVIVGRWKYGMFSMNPVGAKNVGNIELDFDPALVTNKRGQKREVIDDLSFDSVQKKKGERLGGFLFGSTVVLVFEAPENLQFTVTCGQQIKYGQPIATIPK